VEIRTEYTKTVYETYVAESKRIVEMYTELSRNALRSFEGAVGKQPPQATDP
jgi:hypothetical protein